MSFSAKFRSRCGGCDEQIEPGDNADYDDGEVVHSRCVGLTGAVDKTEIVCPNCWTTHVGECL